MKKLSLVIVLVLAIAASFAQTTEFTATYNFMGSGNNVSTLAYNGTDYTPNGLTMGPMEKIGIESTSKNNNFRGKGWPMAPSEPNSGQYIGFTMAARPGYTFTVNNITFGIGRSGTGTHKTVWRGSADNYGTNLTVYDQVNAAIGYDYETGVLTNPDTDSAWYDNILSVHNDIRYQNLTEAGFRMFMYDAEAAGGTAGLYQDVTITGVIQPAGTDPTWSVTPGFISGLDYVLGNGPSAYQSFVIDGSNLTDGYFMVSVPELSNFEIAREDIVPGAPDGYWGSGPLEMGNEVPHTIYVRMKAGLPVGDYDEDVTVSYITQGDQGEVYDNKYVTLNGSVTAPPPPRYFVDFEGDGEFTPTNPYFIGEKMLSGKNWYLTQVVIVQSPTTNEWYDGTRSVRLRGYGTTSMTMREDKTNGAGTVSFQYRQYTGDTQTTWKVQYSTDGGEVWQDVPFDPPNNTFKADGTVREFTYDLNTSRNIRLSIKEATGSGTSNRRMNIDNISITDFYDFYDDVLKTVGNDDITITGGNANYNYAATPGDLPDPNFQASFHDCLTLLGAGPWTIDIQNSTAQWAAYKQGGTWHSTAFANGSATLTVPAAKAADIELLTGIGNNPTVPVTLSHFSATMTAENYVQLTWISQTETNLMGYNVYRNSSDDLGSARQICPMIAGTNTSQAQTYTYLDKDLVEDGTYYYWLQNVDLDGSNAFHGPVSVVFSITGDGGSPAVPTVTQLDDAYPNPFNPNTTIRYQLEGAGKVKINIYNTRGQLVRSFERGHDAAGHFSIVWDGRDSSGRELPSGVYLYNMSSGRYSSSKKMVLKK